MSDIYIPLRELPEPLRACLKEVGFAEADIRVETKETVTPNTGGGGKGCRSFFALVNLATGEHRVSHGSWGGSNMFTQSIPDDMHKPVALQPGTAAVLGSTGYRKTAHIVLHPDNVAALLPAKSELTARQQWILGCFKSLTSAGRKNEFSRCDHPPTNVELEELAAGEYLKINRAGAISITTKGKNSAGRYTAYAPPEASCQ